MSRSIKARSAATNGKPLHHADIHLATPLPPLEPSDAMVNDSGPATAYGRSVATGSPEGRRDHLTWEERNRLQKATKALLLQLGVSELGRWR